MKKIFISACLIFGSLYSANAQWTASGANAYFNLTGNVSVGTTTYPAKFTVYQATALGAVAKNATLLTRVSGLTSNDFQNNLWLVRNAAGSDWFTARLHDGISVDNIYVSPQTDTKTWWERDPYADIQSWGTAANTYFTVKQGSFGIGTVTPSAKFSVTSSGISTLTGYESVADFVSASTTGRARITIANNYNNASTKASSSAIFFAGYNLAGTALEPKWEFGTDYLMNGGKNFYFFNSGIGSAPLFLDANGSVGIAATTPISLFQVEDGFEKASLGPASGAGLLGTSYLGFNAARNGTNWTINADPSHNGGGVIYGDIYGNINFAAIGDIGNTTQTINDATLKTKVALQLTATGIVRAKKVVIELTGWSDYVFDKGYNLPSLQSVKTYIDMNHHLPDVPSAAEVVSNGMDVGEMNKLLMKKIEELTLYLIDSNKQNAKLTRTVLTQGQKLKSLEKRLNSLQRKK